MARQTKPLTAIEIKNAKPKEKKYKLSDGGGLFLQINPNGSKLWRLNYRFNNKLKEYAIGVHPDIDLLTARKKREELRKLVAEGIDINQLKKDKKVQAKEIEQKKENTFYKVAQEWHKNYESEVSENYHYKIGQAIELYLYTYLKNKTMDEISRLDIINILQKLKDKGIIETANRVYMLLNKIYMYAVTLEYVQHNIMSDIDKKTVLGKREKNHYPTLTKEKDIKGLLLAIDEYSGDYTTKKALQILPYVFVRSSNIRHCEWSEIDFEKKIWIIPAEKMKTKDEFILPLPHQVISMLEELKGFSGDGKYIFPSFRGKDKPMSDNTLIGALRRMGYTKEEFVPHSFRAMFSTIAYEKANEKDGHFYTSEVIEALLAHKERNRIKGAYNRATYKESMRELIQWYANYLDGVKNG
ncbi:tyrosine-type recombinase/integrase [Malaciobacter mytili]|uniref:tyrosine-type recombinase/integrase n=1 Tax=Malaciobacter mytili TaxID=603050 RepID=UPI003BB15C8C